MINFPNPKCDKCAHYKSGNCYLHQAQTNQNDSCKNYTESPYICEMCGKHLFTESVFYTAGIQNPFHMICEKCLSAINTCNTCTRANLCRFEQDTSIKEEPYIMQKIQQGFSTIQTQIKNPARIKLTCEENCSCFTNGECQKQNGGSCKDYHSSVPNW